MKKTLYAILLRFIAFISLSLPLPSIAADEVVVTGYCPYGAICLTGNSMYWYMSQNYGYYLPPHYYTYGGVATSEEERKKKEEQKARCTATAGGTAYSCKNAYANLTTICNAYTGALGGWAIKLASEAKGAAAATAAAAGGAASSELVSAVFDVTMPCDKLKDVYEPFCANLGKTLAQKCN